MAYNYIKVVPRRTFDIHSLERKGINQSCGR